jgi:hypothetical protein
MMMPSTVSYHSDTEPIGFTAVHRVVMAAEAAGWPTKAAFEAAAQLLCHGAAPAEAVEMFERCRRWVQ